MNTLGERIKQIRISNNMTQFEFSQRILTSRTFISLIENNKVTPSNSLLRLISIEFKISETWLKNGCD